MSFRNYLQTFNGELKETSILGQKVYIKKITLSELKAFNAFQNTKKPEDQLLTDVLPFALCDENRNPVIDTTPEDQLLLERIPLEEAKRIVFEINEWNEIGRSLEDAKKN